MRLYAFVFKNIFGEKGGGVSSFCGCRPFSVILAALVVIVWACRVSYKIGRGNNDAYDDKNAKHSNAHIVEIAYKIDWFKHSP